MIKRSINFIFFVGAMLQSVWLHAQQNEEVTAKGQLVETPVTVLPQVYQTLQTIFDGNSPQKWVKNQWKTGQAAPDGKNNRLCFYTGRYANGGQVVMQTANIQLPALKQVNERFKPLSERMG